MSAIPCQYAIIRFSPFVETGEFANVGILLVAAKPPYFGFKLKDRRYARITQFFDDVQPRFYLGALAALRNELNRVREQFAENRFHATQTTVAATSVQEVFAEIIRPREAVIRFSAPRIVLADNPANQLETLFDHYVERNFVRKEYPEQALDQGLRHWLQKVQIADRFTEGKIGDKQYQATFPFIAHERQRPTKVIKPLHLAQDQSSKIIEHAGTWVFRLSELKKRGVLPRKVLFAVDGPDADGDRTDAYLHATQMLEETGITVVPYDARNEIMDFALTA